MSLDLVLSESPFYLKLNSSQHGATPDAGAEERKVTDHQTRRFQKPRKGYIEGNASKGDVVTMIMQGVR